MLLCYSSVFCCFLMVFILFQLLLLLPVRIVNGFFSSAFSRLMKWILSLRDTTKTAISGRPMMKFESGYTVETVFDGSKLGIEPHSVEVLPNGDLLILDSSNSNLYKFSSSLSLYSRPRLITGSADGYSGYVDGKLREARMNHPKGLTVDDGGNIYIADTDNMSIRKISNTGVTTIAGGKWSRGNGHVDGPSGDAKFSNDFDVVYIGSSCSLLVIDRGNNAIREIQLHFDDCAYQYGSSFPLGIVVLIAAGFFGYMLALLQRRVGSIVSSQDGSSTYGSSVSSREEQGVFKASILYQNAYQKQLKSSVLSPLIPTEDEQEKLEESFFRSLGRLVAQTGASAAEILGGVFPVFRRNQYNQQYQNQVQQQKYSNTWPVQQDSFVIPDEDEPPSIETRTSTPGKTYAFMSKDSEKMQRLRQSRAFYNGWEGEFQNQQTQKKQHHHRYHSSVPQIYYEQTSEKTSEIVFGAVQEQEEQRESVVPKPLNHGIPAYDHSSIRARLNYGHGR
ncbi:NHL domain-containing isoform 3 [Olea europaea subsp. europaea]|uniref:NHL domain-containing isoform 3 n=1 Tax=Olea europaea subsp. europaea TaxID=158383 RepID=A0A8S0VI77_OLEEU|nr:NHL domain-containing isoform 3 [Olea europaea subsp. europaea]